MSSKITASANAAAHAIVSILDQAYADEILDGGYPDALADYLDSIDAPTLITITVHVNAPSNSGASNGHANSKYQLLPTRTEGAR